MSNGRVRQRKRYRRKEEMGRARKQLGRDRKPPRVRQKNWTPADLDEWDEIDDLPSSERIAPLGEHERRRSGLQERLSILEQGTQTSGRTADGRQTDGADPHQVREQG